MSRPARKPHVVVIDRDRWVAKALGRSLQVVGCEVVTFTNEWAARAHLSTEHPIAIVCEFYEGEADGVAALRWAKTAMPFTARCLLSCELGVVSPAQRDELGPCFFVPKPWTMSDIEPLSSAVRRMLT